MKFKDYLLFSDVDGTLLPYTENAEVPKRNIEAIERFIKQGGSFGLATGRSKVSAEEFVKLLPVNVPCVVLNGGGLYDYAAEEYLMMLFLPDEAKVYVKQIMEELPRISVLVVVKEDYYHLTPEIEFESFTSEYRKNFKDVNPETMDVKWSKTLFSGKEEELIKLRKYIGAHDFKGIRFVETNETLIELLPENSDKGNAIKTLASMKGYKRERIAAIGDYYNDLEMLEYAGVGATVEEALDEIKGACDFVAGKCEDGAVADFIEYLESMYE